MQIKSALISTGYFEDTVPCHLASGLGAGFFAVCFGSPVDVVKSRLMGECHLPGSAFCVGSCHASRLLSAGACHIVPWQQLLAKANTCISYLDWLKPQGQAGLVEQATFLLAYPLEYPGHSSCA